MELLDLCELTQKVIHVTLRKNNQVYYLISVNMYVYLCVNIYTCMHNNVSLSV